VGIRNVIIAISIVTMTIRSTVVTDLNALLRNYKVAELWSVLRTY